MSLGGTYTAWLSDSTTNAIDRVTGTGPWYLVDRCTQVFANKAAITAQGPAVAIDRTPSNTMAPPVDIWTGTLSTGAKDSWTCHDWTNDTFQWEGTIGLGDNSLVQGGWTEGSTPTCDGSGLLICFEQ